MTDDSAKCKGCMNHVDPNFSFLICNDCQGITHYDCCTHSYWDANGIASNNVVAEFVRH